MLEQSVLVQGDLLFALETLKLALEVHDLVGSNQRAHLHVLPFHPQVLPRLDDIAEHLTQLPPSNLPTPERAD